MTVELVVGALVAAGALLVPLEVGRRRGNTAAVVNAAVALVVTLVPFALDAVSRLDGVGPLARVPTATVWIAVAGGLHSAGMLGLYESTSWWDHLTHTVSAALVASLVYAGLLVVVPPSAGAGWLAVGAATVGVTLLAGVAWELLELAARDVGRRHGVQPVLVYYGRWDAALDLVFDVVGAGLVLGADVRVFVPLTAPYPRAVAWVLVAFASALLVVVGLLLGYLAIVGRPGFADDR